MSKLSTGEMQLFADETIKLVGYSMGAAFAAGMANVISQDATYGSKLQFVDYLAPYQGDQFKHPWDVFGRQFQIDTDIFAGLKKIENIDNLNFYLKDDIWYENIGTFGGHLLGNTLYGFLQSCFNAGVPIHVK